jgi:hypothetical protein
MRVNHEHGRGGALAYLAVVSAVLVGAVLSYPGLAGSERSRSQVVTS